MLNIQNLSKRYGNKALFEGVDCMLPASGRIALVGQNGAGKTTLLRIITGEEEADAGGFQLKKGAVLGYLPQEPRLDPEPTVLAECESGAKELFRLRCAVDEAVTALEGQGEDQEAIRRHAEAESAFASQGGYELTARASAILRGLGFVGDVLEQDPRQLSGGWRMRLELAKIFLNRPDVLILDEPTNHLDLPSLAWVESWLKQFRGTLLFVSHDRALLNRLSTHTLHLSQGVLTLYKGGFDRFLDQLDADRQRSDAERERLQKKMKQHQDFVDRFGAKATKARQAQSRVKMIAKLRALEQTVQTYDDEKTVALSLKAPKRSGREVLRVEGLAIGYPGQQALATGIDFLVERGQKVAVIGANGIGKSTLIKTLVGEVAVQAGAFDWGKDVVMGYFAQNQAERLAAQKSLLEQVLSTSAEVGEPQARQLLGGLLFSGEDVAKTTGVLSGGEKNRLGMACLLAKPANMLLLDEPTNHLDMASVEVLTQAFQDYEGSMMFVSHDRGFIDALATHILVMLPDGRSRLFHGRLEDYQRMAEQTGFPDVLSGESAVVAESEGQEAATELAPATKGAPEQRVKALRTQRNRLERQVANDEKRIELVRQRLQELEQEMAAVAAADFEQLQKLTAEANGLTTELTGLEESWLEASEEAENLTAQLQAMGRL